MFIWFLLIAILFTTTFLNWDEIVCRLRGKKVAILGGQAVGKTTLCDFLSKGSIPEKYEQTSLDRTCGRYFKLEELNLKIYLKSSWDVGGGDKSRPESLLQYWKKIVDQSEIVFYLVNVYVLLNPDLPLENFEMHEDYLSRVRRGLRDISN
jgi:GTPase SAR1 family protein